MTPIRAALLGYGLAGAAFHAPLIADDPAYDLVAIVTRDPERRERAAAAHPTAERLDVAEDVWARAGELDLAVIATPNRTHVPLTRAALDHGLHVVVDKPLAATADEARDLAAHAAAAGRVLTAFHNRRWDGDFLTARRVIAAGDLGEVARWESRFDRWRPARKADAWRERADPAEAGGLLYDLGTHLVDQALLALGPAQAVYAELDRRRPGALVDDDAFVAILHAGGTRSHHWVTSLAAQPGPRLRVLGTRAAYVKHGLDVQEAALRAGARPSDPGFGVEPESAWGILATGDDRAPTVVPTEPGRYAAFYAQLAAALDGTGPPPVAPSEAVAALEVLEAARASTAAGTVVTLA